MPAMIKSTLLPGLAALGLAFTLYAQSDADYTGWMKELGGSRPKMQKAIAAKQGPEIAAEAEKVAGIYKNMVTFWEGRKAAKKTFWFFLCVSAPLRETYWDNP